MRPMDLGDTDPLFVSTLAERPESAGISACFTCRTCTASCPVKVIRLAAYGFKDVVLKSTEIWLCAGCYTCQERCPQKVPITDFMTLLKNMACAEGCVPHGVRLQRDTVLKGGGRMYPIDEFDNKKRLKAGLPELPVSCEAAALLFEGDKATGDFGSERQLRENP
jgi:heterodisulfide reductase subunit C2